MTELLQQVIAEITKLPGEQQDAITTCFLTELKYEQAWQESFEVTTDIQLDNLAAMVCQDIDVGNTVPLDETFPVSR